MTRTCASSGVTATVPKLPMPAFATTTSIPPSAAPVPDTARSRAAWSVTSHSNQACPPPSSAARDASRSGSIPTRESRAPRAASARATASPMPRAGPVTKATLPVKVSVMCSPVRA